MSAVMGIRNVSSYADYGKIASGKKIHQASDGAAELSMIQKHESAERSYQAGSGNIKNAQGMINVADGAMSGITDYLQRIRELAVQASNTAVVSDSDRVSIQKEIDQMKQGISDIASNTTFNTKPLLDGSSKEFHIAVDGNGNEMQVSGSNATLEALGIADFDVTGEFDIDTIDKALESVSAGRSTLGAQSNALDYAYSYNSGAAFNVTASKSSLEDLDIPEAVSEKKKQETLQEYSVFMQRKKMEEEENRMRSWFI